MSLINDALKRAKEAQPAEVSAAGPSLHPVRGERARPDFLMGMLVVVILLLAGLLFWAWSHGAGVMKVRANSFPEAATSMLMPTAVAVAQPVATPTVVEVPKVAVVVETVTNLPVVVAVAAVKPEVIYKLQGIFYFAKNPSAVINGKTVYAGSHVGEAQVVVIGKDSATLLLGTGETRVLELR